MVELGQQHAAWAVWAGVISRMDLRGLESASLVVLMCSCTLVDVTCTTLLFTFARLYLKEKALRVKKAQLTTCDSSHLSRHSVLCIIAL